MIQALPEVSITGQWLTNKMKDNIKRLADANLIVHGIISDDHSANVSAFSNNLKKYVNSDFSIFHPIIIQNVNTYSFTLSIC